MKYSYYLQKPEFTVKNLEIHSVSRPKGYSHSFRNGRGNHGFIYIISGKMGYEMQKSENSMYACAGELVFIPKGTVYTGVYAEECTKIKIVQFELAEGSMPAYLSEVRKIDLPNASELFEAFFRPAKNNFSSHPFYYLSCVYELLWQIDEAYSKLPAKFKKLQAALSEITNHLNENKPISHYAELCYTSEASFRRLFHEYTGMSPIEYRNDLRLKNAKSMLQSGEYNVSEVAELSGFSNLSFFIRLYKKKYGCTPKKE